MIVFGIDPGPQESAFVVWDGKAILDYGILKNDAMIALVIEAGVRVGKYNYAIEGVQSYGKAVGASIFKTCYMIGRILEAAIVRQEDEDECVVHRPAIKAWLCGDSRAKDKDVRASLISMFGKEVTKNCTGHVWSAFAVAAYQYDFLKVIKKRII